MNKEKKPKHHRICMKCHVQSTGKSVKECEESFPRCGLTGGVPNAACNTTMYQDGQKIFEIIKVVDLEKLRTGLETQKAIATGKAAASKAASDKRDSDAKAAAKIEEAKTTKQPPKDNVKNNSKAPKN